MKPGEKAAAPRRRLTAVLERAGLALAMGGSFFLIWWSIDRLATAQRHAATLGDQAARIASEIAVMRSQWPEGSSQKVQARYAEAADALFHSPDAIAEWHETLRTTAIPLALEPSLAVSHMRQTNAGATAVTVVAADIDIAPAVGIATESTPYSRLLQLAHTLGTQSRRADVVGLTVSAGSNSVSHARATVELWAAVQEEPKP